MTFGGGGASAVRSVMKNGPSICETDHGTSAPLVMSLTRNRSHENRLSRSRPPAEIISVSADA
jgi:hypothetical protein